MKTTVSLYDFRGAFRAYDRDNFSYEGLEVLFDYLEGYEEDTGEELELDVVALCCDYAEDTFENIAREYSVDIEECEDPEDIKEVVLEFLYDNTSVVGEVGGDSVIYQGF